MIPILYTWQENAASSYWHLEGVKNIMKSYSCSMVAWYSTKQAQWDQLSFVGLPRLFQFWLQGLRTGGRDLGDSFVFNSTAFYVLTLWTCQHLVNFFYSHKSTEGMYAISYLLHISVLPLGRINSIALHKFKSVNIYICSDKSNRRRTNVISAIIS